MSTIITDGMPVDALMQIRDMVDEQIRDRAQKPTVTTKTKTKVKVKPTKKQEKELQKALKQVKKDRKKAKAKAKKNKAKKGLKKVTSKVASGSKKAVRKSKSGIRRAGRSVRNFGSRMWRRAVGASKWVWSKTKWLGRKAAAGGGWLLGGATRLVQWTISGLGWGWIIIGAAGVVVLALMTWGVSAGSEAASAPLAWLAAGRPGSLKKFKAKRRDKELKKTQKQLQKRADRLAKATKQAQKDADKVAKKTAKQSSSTAPKVLAKSKTAKSKTAKSKTAKSKTAKSRTTTVKTTKLGARKPVLVEIETTETIEPELAEEHKVLEAEAERLIAKAAAEDYTDLEGEGIVEALQLRLDALKEAGVPKDAYSVAAGRFWTAEYIVGNGPLRGKQLYQALRAKVLKGYGGEKSTADERLKLASAELNWTKFQAGIAKEQELLADRFPMVAAKS